MPHMRISSAFRTPCTSARVLLAVALAMAAGARGGVSYVNTTADSFGDGAATTTPRGALGYLFTKDATYRQTYIRFELSQAVPQPPAGATLDFAAFSIYTSGGIEASSVRVNRMRSDATASWSEATLTYVNMQAPLPSPQVVLRGAATQSTRWEVNLDPQTFLADFWDRQAVAEVTIVLRYDPTCTGAGCDEGWFVSKEGAGAGLEPAQLELTWTPPPTTGSTGSTGTTATTGTTTTTGTTATIGAIGPTGTTGGSIVATQSDDASDSAASTSAWWLWAAVAAAACLIVGAVALMVVLRRRRRSGVRTGVTGPSPIRDDGGDHYEPMGFAGPSPAPGEGDHYEEMRAAATQKDAQNYHNVGVGVGTEDQYHNVAAQEDAYHNVR
jgi:hypothetical protein